jgi:hypothetical protein
MRGFKEAVAMAKVPVIDFTPFRGGTSAGKAAVAAAISRLRGATCSPHGTAGPSFFGRGPAGLEGRPAVQRMEAVMLGTKKEAALSRYMEGGPRLRGADGPGVETVRRRSNALGRCRFRGDPMSATTLDFGTVRDSAVFSASASYRYRLDREIGGAGPP